ncbi:hypothetical protein OGAPHI_001177 [Ogataea philodendri]|uniref:Eukaryotic translation initiation factor 3 subunit J n=1 Tax=Ogataea philodendri TaxID=1378263 RepID=A0A9P8PG58_9ASCO|nr:uncharacterized protein OGAPHI_001177 [Ogataea philodendri]KAH3670662.1 hypothetical protein OGAPHI_001177 [Ogataea philodendri]
MSWVTESWEDQLEDDEPVLDSWDVDSEEERAKEAEKKAAAAKKTVTKAPKAVKGGKKKTAEKSALEIDLVDEKTRREMLKEAELNSDLNNAADLFGGLGVANEHPRAKALAAEQAAKAAAPKLDKDTPLTALPIFDVETKQDYEKLRKAVSPALTNLAKKSQLHYSTSLAVDLIRDLCGPMSVENTRKVVSTLNAMITQKVKEERQARLAKTGGTSTGGAGKKKVKGQVNIGSSFKKDNYDDLLPGDDDFGDDDFM